MTNKEIIKRLSEIEDDLTDWNYIHGCAGCKRNSDKLYELIEDMQVEAERAFGTYKIKENKNEK